MTSGTFQGGYSAMFIASRKSPLKVGFSVFCTGVKANVVGRCLEGRSGLLSSLVNIIAHLHILDILMITLSLFKHFLSIIHF